MPARDRQILKRHNSPELVADILAIFMEEDVGAVLGLFGVDHDSIDAVKLVEERTGRKMILMDSPILSVDDNTLTRQEAERTIKECAERGTKFCLPLHSCIEQLVNKNMGTTNRLLDYLKMIRDVGMIPGLSAHMLELIQYVDENEYDAETYIQIFNCMGFLIQVEIESAVKIIHNAKKPVITIKPCAVGRTTPYAGLNFSYNAIRSQDMACIGCFNGQGAYEDIGYAKAAIERRMLDIQSRNSPLKASIINGSRLDSVSHPFLSKCCKLLRFKVQWLQNEWEQQCTRVTIRGIVRETELSPTTVSIVLNNKPHRLSAEMRKKVLDAAERMNYRPNSLVTSPKTYRTKTIGIVISSFTNSYFGELARGAEARYAQDGYALILCNTNGKSKKNLDYINILIDRGVDGIIVSFDGIEADETDRLIAYMLSFGIKIISIDYRTQYKPASNVMLDNKMDGFLATRHLIEQEHRKIGCITGPLRADSSTANQRYPGYKQALEKYQIEVNEKSVVYGEYNIESGIKHADMLLPEGVTGIVAVNDLCAYGIYKWAREHGITIPDDLSVVGCDDVAYSDFFSPRLTTIHRPAYDMGFEAAGKIIESCEDISDDDKDLVFKPELVTGGSTRHL